MRFLKLFEARSVKWDSKKSVNETVFDIIMRLDKNQFLSQSGENESSLTIASNGIQYGSFSSNYFKLINKYNSHISIIDKPSRNIFKKEKDEELYQHWRTIYKKLWNLFTDSKERKLLAWIAYLNEVDKRTMSKLFVYINKSNCLNAALFSIAWKSGKKSEPSTVFIEFLLDDTFNLEDLDVEEKFKFLEFVTTIKEALHKRVSYDRQNNPRIPIDEYVNVLNKAEKILRQGSYLIRGKGGGLWDMKTEKYGDYRDDDELTSEFSQVKELVEEIVRFRDDIEIYKNDLSMSTILIRKEAEACRDYFMLMCDIMKKKDFKTLEQVLDWEKPEHTVTIIKNIKNIQKFWGNHYKFLPNDIIKFLLDYDPGWIKQLEPFINPRYKDKFKSELRQDKADLWGMTTEGYYWWNRREERIRKMRLKHLKRPSDFLNDDEKEKYQRAKASKAYKDLTKKKKINLSEYVATSRKMAGNYQTGNKVLELKTDDITRPHEQAKGVFRFLNKTFNIKFNVSPDFVVYFERPATNSVGAFSVAYRMDSYEEAFDSISRNLIYLNYNVIIDEWTFEEADDEGKLFMLMNLYNDLKTIKTATGGYDKEKNEYERVPLTLSYNVKNIKFVPEISEVPEKFRYILYNIYDFIENVLYKNPELILAEEEKTNSFGFIPNSNLKYLNNFPTDLIYRINWENIFDKFDPVDVLPTIKWMEKQEKYKDFVKKLNLGRSNQAGLWDFKG